MPTCKPVALVFNGLKVLQPRGISRFTSELVTLLEERSVAVREVVIPPWLFRGPRLWKIAVVIAYQQLVMPALALWYRPDVTFDAYNAYPVAVSLLAPTVGVIHDFIPFQRRWWALRPGTVYQRILHKLTPCMPHLVIGFVSEGVLQEARKYVRVRRGCLLPNIVKPLPIASDGEWRVAPQARAMEEARARGDVVVTTISGDGAHKDFGGLTRMLAECGASVTLVAFGFAADAAPQRVRADAGARHLTVLRYGPTDASVIGRAVRDSDVFVFHSLREGFGRPVCEALWCGTPVVSAVVPALGSLSEEARKAVFSYEHSREFGAAFDAARRSAHDVPAQVLRVPPERHYDDLLSHVVSGLSRRPGNDREPN